MKIILKAIGVILGLLVLLYIGARTGPDEMAMYAIIIGCVLVVFVLPALLIVLLFVAIWKGLSHLGKEKTRLAGEHDQREVTVDFVALVGFLRKAKRQGMSDEAVSRRCRANGWSDAEIEKAHQCLN